MNIIAIGHEKWQTFSCIANYRELASAVVEMAVKDMIFGGYNMKRATETEISVGGLDLWLATVGVKLTREEFIRLVHRAAEAKAQKRAQKG